MLSKDIKKYLLITAGSISLGLGLAGVFIPVLPTTPFLLVTAFCYARSSRRLYRWLMSHKVFGPYIYNYIKHHAVPRRTKIAALILLWLSLGLSIFLIDHLHVRIVLLIVGLAVSVHLISLKTIKNSQAMPTSDQLDSDSENHQDTLD